MPNNIDQPDILLHFPQNFSTLSRHLYPTPPSRFPNAPCPFSPNPKCLLYPRSEANFLYHRCSRNFLARKAAPRYCVHRVAALAALEDSRGITRVVAYLTFLLEVIKVWLEFRGKGRSGDKEFDKGFLEDEAAWWAPAMDGVGRGQTINGGLGGDRPIALTPD